MGNVGIGVGILTFLALAAYFISSMAYLKGEERIVYSLKNDSEVTYNLVTYGCKLQYEQLK